MNNNLECSLEDLESFFNGIPLGITLKDHNDCYIYMNKTAEIGIDKVKSNCIHDDTVISHIDKGDNIEINTLIKECNYENKKKWYKERNIRIFNSNMKDPLFMKITSSISIHDEFIPESSEAYLLNKELDEEKQDSNIIYQYKNFIISSLMNIILSYDSVECAIFMYNSENNEFAMVSNSCKSNLFSNFKKCINLNTDSILNKYLNIDTIVEFINNDSKSTSINIEEIIVENKFAGFLMIIYDKQYYDESYILYSITSSIKNQLSKIKNITNMNLLLKRYIKELALNKKITRELNLFLGTASDLNIVAKKTNENKIIYKRINNSSRKYKGWTKDELNSDNHRELYKSQNLDYIKDLITESLNKNIRSGKHVCRAICKNNEFDYIEFRWKLLDDNETIVLCGIDRTEQFILEQKKNKLEKNIHIENVKKNFFSNLSFEFKEPINNLMSIVQLLELYSEKERKIGDDSDDLQYIYSIRKNSYKLLKQVNDLIDISKIDSEFYETTMYNYNFVEIVENTIDASNAYFCNNRRKIIFNTNNEEIILACDSHRIEKVIFNLICIIFIDTDNNILVEVEEMYKENFVRVSIKCNINMVFGKLKHDINEILSSNNIKIFHDDVNSRLKARLTIVNHIINLHKGCIYIDDSYMDGINIVFEIPMTKVNIKDNNYIADKSMDSTLQKCKIEYSFVEN